MSQGLSPDFVLTYRAMMLDGVHEESHRGGAGCEV
jgi:hypothetical protein